MTTDEYTREAQRLRQILLRTAMSYLHENDDAEDIVQDTMLRLWQIHPDLRMPIHPLASIIIRNLCVSRLRSNGTISEVPFPNISEADEDNPDQERIERVMKIIEDLPDVQQTLLRLRHIVGMDTRRISELMGSSEVAVRKALSRARISVREQYIRMYKNKNI